jgi:aspartate aminotransferase
MEKQEMITRRLARRVEALKPSSTISVGKAAKALAASGVDVVDFGLGEPDFATPDFVGRAGCDAIEAGKTKYTDVAGDPALREAIAARFKARDGAEFSRDNVIVTAGAKQAVFNVCQALFDEGDEVAIFSPYWVSFPDMVRLAGAKPVFIPTDIASGWKPAAEALARHASKDTRGVIVNSPNNPTGAVIDDDELSCALDWCAEEDIFLIFDETYDRFLYDGKKHVSAARFKDHADHVIITGAASKTYSMTGWRLGWAVGPKEIVKPMADYQSHSTSNASSISQAAVLAALNDPERTEESVAGMLAEYVRRREAMVKGLTAVSGVRAPWPEGAFYSFADVSALYGKKKLHGSAAFCERLLSEAHVAAVPGEAFGDDRCVRFSFATSIERIQEGMRRFAEWAGR